MQDQNQDCSAEKNLFEIALALASLKGQTLQVASVEQHDVILESPKAQSCASVNVVPSAPSSRFVPCKGKSNSAFKPEASLDPAVPRPILEKGRIRMATCIEKPVASVKDYRAYIRRRELVEIDTGQRTKRTGKDLKEAYQQQLIDSRHNLQFNEYVDAKTGAVTHLKDEAFNNARNTGEIITKSTYYQKTWQQKKRKTLENSTLESANSFFFKPVGDAFTEPKEQESITASAPKKLNTTSASFN